jgi:hypothetical protein
MDFDPSQSLDLNTKISGLDHQGRESSHHKMPGMFSCTSTKMSVSDACLKCLVRVYPADPGERSWKVIDS